MVLTARSFSSQERRRSRGQTGRGVDLTALWDTRPRSISRRGEKAAQVGLREGVIHRRQRRYDSGAPNTGASMASGLVALRRACPVRSAPCPCPTVPRSPARSSTNAPIPCRARHAQPRRHTGLATATVAILATWVAAWAVGIAGIACVAVAAGRKTGCLIRSSWLPPSAMIGCAGRCPLRMSRDVSGCARSG